MSHAYDDVKRWRYRTKERAVQAFGGCCGICGYNKCFTSLHFHHVDPRTKKFTLGSMKKVKWSEIVSELRKCVCLCSNCHGEVETGITQIPQKIKRFDESFVEYKEPFVEEYDICLVCKGPKKKRFKYCSKVCSSYANRKIDWDKVDLKSLVRKKMPLETIGEILGVSGNAVKKRLQAMGIPTSRYERKYTSKSPDFYQHRKIKNGALYKGVTLSNDPRYKSKHRVWITLPNKKRVYVGSFLTAIEAAKAYDRRAIELLGENAITNKSLGRL